MTEITILPAAPCHLGEGPFYCQRRETLFWFDIVERKRHAHAFRTGTAHVMDLPEMTSAMAVTADGHDVLFTETGLYRLDDGRFTLIAAIEADNPVTRCNDARVHPSGAFWLGTMGKNAEHRAGAIYHYLRGTLTLLFAEITIPNAICFSPDGQTAYFTDTPMAKLMRVPVDPATGLPAGEPAVFIDHGGGVGGLDGAICDGGGRVWNARWGASALDSYDPSGAHLQTIDLPVTQPSCPAFAGGNRIAVTSAWQGMDEAARRADPDAGATLLVAPGIDVPAQFEPALMV